MNNFIKKNMFLVGFLALSALGAVALLVVAVMLHAEMSGYIRQTEDMAKKVRDLRNQRPPAVKENIEKVQKNSDGYGQAAAKLRLCFGQIFHPALTAFVKKLDLKLPEGETDQVEYLQKLFRNFWEETKKSHPRERAYLSFRNMGPQKQYWSQDKWDEAMKVFREHAEEVTEEKIDERNIEDIFLSALGLERTVNDQALLDVYMRFLRISMVDLLNKNNVKLVGVYFNNSNIGIAPLTDNRAFNDFSRRSGSGEGDSRREMQHSSLAGGGESGAATNADRIPGIMRNWEIMSDLVRRIAESKVDSLDKLNMDNLEGRRQDDFTIFRYEIVVQGTPEAIRKLLNKLTDAYRDNRVYVVRNFSIQKLEDQAQDLMDMEEGLLTVSTGAAESSPDLGDGSGRNSAEESSRTASTERIATAQNFFREKGVYGEVVTGRNPFCEADIVVDYVIYSAKEVK